MSISEVTMRDDITIQFMGSFSVVSLPVLLSSAGFYSSYRYVLNS